MLPNNKFLKIFPQEILPVEKDGYRSGCLRIGAYIVIRKIISDYRLDIMLARIVGKDAGLFLDLAAYTVITEGNAAQYYPDYAFNHPLLTDDMRIYSDSKVSDFLGRVTIDQRILFLNEWNEKRDHREKSIYPMIQPIKHARPATSTWWSLGIQRTTRAGKSLIILSRMTGTTGSHCFMRLIRAAL